MKTARDRTHAARSIWRHRGRRLLLGLNLTVAVALAVALFAMVNYLANRYYARWDWSGQRTYALSDKTRGLLRGLNEDVSVMAFFRRANPLYEEVRGLLKTYDYTAAREGNQHLRVRFIDPDRDIGRVRTLMEQYDVRDANCVVFEAGGRKKYVEAKDIVDYEVTLVGSHAVRKLVGIRAEQAFSSAILSVSQAAKPVVYFVAGHGERDPEDYGENTGYSSLARAMRRDNIEVRSLLLAEHHGVPKDCSALIVAGPRRLYATAEADWISEYMDRSGRILFLLDPVVPTGLETLVEQWGLKLANDVVVDPRLTMTGHELFVTHYGDHPITQRLGKLATVFYQPRSITPISGPAGGSDAAVDRPRVTVLAACSQAGWAETDFNENAVKFDADSDRRGPIPVAVAVEKGLVGGLQAGIRPTRLVVIGDSSFVSNAALSSAVGGNVDFFMNALNWLLERESLLAIAPKPPNELRLDMSRRQLEVAMLVVVGGAPLLAAAWGLGVWWRRKR